LRVASGSTTLPEEMEEEIHSRDNPRLKAVALLAREASARREAKIALVEGSREVERAMDGGWVPTEIFIDPSRASEETDARVRAAERAGARVIRCSQRAFDKISYRENPDGVLAVGPVPATSLASLSLSPSPLILVAESVEKPGNVGALLRTADAVGADAVFVCGSAVDLGNPNLIRASIGTVFYVPVVPISSADAARWLRERGIRIVTAEPAASIVYTEADLMGPAALVVGAEDAGVSSVWQEAADVRVSIPMRGRNDSLNVSVAAAVLLFEAVRQRGGRQPLPARSCGDPIPPLE